MEGPSAGRERLALADPDGVAGAGTTGVVRSLEDGLQPSPPLVLEWHLGPRPELEKALEERDSSVTSNRVDIAVALNVCHFLGSTVLVTKSGR